jgi:colanic acid biosynthesis glycosyl transferase WcaI
VRLVFINRFYWPDEPATAQLLTDLATALAARGHAVTIITSQPSAMDVPRAEIRDGVRIWRVRGTRWGRHSLAGRAVDFATFLAGALWRVLRTIRKGDTVVAMTDPPLLGVAVWPVAGLRGVRCLHWVQDIFPEIGLALSPNLLARAVCGGLRPWRNLAWRHSAGCVAVGQDMAGFIAQAGIPADQITTISNWAPAGLEPQPPGAAAELRQAWGLEGRFLVVYSGNLGRVHDLTPVLELAFTLRTETRMAFLFIGDGAQRAALEQAARARGLTNVHFHPAQPRARLAQTLALGDVHLVTLRAGCEALVFPSKLYGIAAVGRPVLFIGPRDCEVARIVGQCGFGQAFTRDEPTAMAHALQGLAANPVRCAALGTRAVEFSRAAGRLDQAVAAWEERLTREAAC